MDTLDKIQQKQEDYYWFPYHYVSSYKNGFTQCFVDTWGINYAGTLEFILEKLKKESFNSIIDIGCGDGRLTKDIKELFPDKSVLGVDYSSKAIALSKAMNYKTNIKFIKANIIKDNHHIPTCDAGVLMEVFEHIHPQEAPYFVESIAQILNENAFLYVTVPHKNDPLEEAHYRHFDKQLLIESFHCHFKVDEVIFFEKISNKKHIIDRLLTNKFFILNHYKFKLCLYNYYKRNLFFVNNEAECKRLFIKFRKI